jgi:hypothetical protein
MTPKERYVAENIIREMAARKAHWYRVRVCGGLLAVGAASWWLLAWLVGVL